MRKRHYSTLPKTSHVARYSKFGNAKDVVKIVEEPVPALKTGDILVKMLFAPINPVDLSMISGGYPVLPSLPGVAGSEGVGKIVAVGDGVKDLKVNDLVVPASATIGTWRTYAVCKEKDLYSLPPSEGVKPEYLSSLSINPTTAYRLLNDFVQLKEGDVVIQNGANSMVGLSVVQLAHARGIKTINIIRKMRPDYETLVEKIKEYGGYLACGDDYIVTPEFRQLISDLPKPKLALNCIGGNTVTEMARLLGKGGSLVTYGGMSNKSINLPTSLFIFNDLQLKGFWLNDWIKQHSKKEINEMFKELIKLMKEGKLRLWHERHPFTNLSVAIQRSQDSLRRERKILLSFE